MPLPDRTTVWPPKHLERSYEAYQVWNAWYAGDTEALQALYATNRLMTASSLWGQVKRMFWGTPTPTTTSQRPNKLHVPIASEIARMSSMLLFSEMPDVHFGDMDRDADDAGLTKKTGLAATERLTELLDDNAHARLLEGAEYAAALGGCFWRVSWDQVAVPGRPFITTVSPDAAVPEFRWGRLTAVTFWHELDPVESAAGVYRLLERHEPGTIEWGLYRSANMAQLGQRVPLSDHPDTAHLGFAVNEQAQVETGSTLLTAVYMPNMQPNRMWRTDPHAKNLGRSDFDGAEPLMDALDEAETSYNRDIRLSKTRIMVPKGMLQTNGPGLGSVFNADQEVFTELGDQIGSLNPTAQGGAVESFIKTFQPVIRWQEHVKTTEHLINRIYAACGYSAQSFGEEGNVAITATEATMQEKVSVLTRQAKILQARPQLRHLFAALLDVDEFVYGGPGRGEALPDIEFADAAAENPKILAETLNQLNLSESASIRTRVEIWNPDWDEEQIMAEVDRIREDYSMLPFPKPAMLWAAQSATGSNTGGVDANSYGVKGVNVEGVSGAPVQAPDQSGKTDNLTPSPTKKP